MRRSDIRAIIGTGAPRRALAFEPYGLDSRNILTKWMDELLPGWEMKERNTGFTFALRSSSRELSLRCPKGRTAAPTPWLSTNMLTTVWLDTGQRSARPAFGTAPSPREQGAEEAEHLSQERRDYRNIPSAAPARPRAQVLTARAVRANASPYSARRPGSDPSGAASGHGGRHRSSAQSPSTLSASPRTTRP